MTEEQSKPKISLAFDWSLLRPDMRQYKQQSIEVLPKAVTIQVEIDLTHETVANSEAILQAQLGAGKEPKPILTVTGMRQAMEAFEAVLLDDVKEQVEPVWEDADFDEDEAPIDVTEEFADTSEEDFGDEPADDWEDEADIPDEEDDQSWEEDDKDDWS